MQLQIRVPAEEEYEEWVRIYLLASSIHITESAATRRRPWIESDRLLSAYDGGQMVGTTVTSSLEMSIPGGALPTGRVDDVGVSPTHRRRGILTGLMTRQLSDIHDRGEPLAMLEASESIIYGRFGFGIGALVEDWSIERQHTAFVSHVVPRGQVRFVDPEEATRVYPSVNDRVSEQRSGMVRYHQAFWDYFLSDLRCSGSSALFHVVYGGDEPDGCASYRVRDKRLEVRYLIAATDDAYAALWSFLLNVDLVASFQANGRAVDEALPWMLADPRRLRRSVRDESWVRVVDVEAALSARSYARPGRLRIEVRDPTPLSLERPSLGAGGRARRGVVPTNARVAGPRAVRLGAGRGLPGRRPVRAPAWRGPYRGADRGGCRDGRFDVRDAAPAVGRCHLRPPAPGRRTLRARQRACGGRQRAPHRASTLGRAVPQALSRRPEYGGAPLWTSRYGCPQKKSTRSG